MNPTRSDGKKTETDRNDVADLGESPAIVAGHDFAHSGPFAVLKRLPGYEYFHARPDGEGSYDGTVGAQLFKGYEIDPTQKSLAHGHVLMRIPIEQWKKLRQQEHALSEANLANTSIAAETVKKDADHGIKSGHR